jgi:hypothetical protein
MRAGRRAAAPGQPGDRRPRTGRFTGRRRAGFVTIGPVVSGTVVVGTAVSGTVLSSTVLSTTVLSTTVLSGTVISRTGFGNTEVSSTWVGSTWVGSALIGSAGHGARVVSRRILRGIGDISRVVAVLCLTDVRGNLVFRARAGRCSLFGLAGCGARPPNRFPRASAGRLAVLADWSISFPRGQRVVGAGSVRAASVR